MKKGFTILEMVVALSIVILILSAFLFRFRGFSDQRRIDMVRGDLRALQTAIHAYYLNHNNAYPNGSDWQNNDLVNDNPRVLRQVLYDPFAGTGGTDAAEYRYHISSNGVYYVVSSVGPDGSSDVGGIQDDGAIQDTSNDDIFVTNGIDS